MFKLFRAHKESIILYANNASVAILNFLSIAFLSHILIPNDYGMYRYMLMLVSICISLGSLGFSQAVFYYIYQAANKAEEYAYINANRIAILMSFALSVALFYLISKILPIADNTFAIDRYNGLLIAVIFAGIVQSIELNIFLKNHKTWFYFTNIICSYIIRLTLFYVAYLSQASLFTYVNIWFLNSLLSIVINQIYIEILYDSQKFRISKLFIKQVIMYSLPIGAGLFFGVLLSQVDRVVLTYLFKDPVKLAIVSNGNFEVPIITAFYTSFYTIAFPKMLYAYNSGNKHEMLFYRHEYQRVVAILLFPIVLSFIFFSQEIITIVFGNYYVESVKLFTVYAITFLFRFTSYHDLFMVTKKTKYIAYIQAIELVVHIILTFVFINMFDIIGASIAVLVTNIMYFAVASYLGAKAADVPFFKLYPFKNLLKQILISLLLLLPFYLLIDAINTQWLKVVLIIIYTITNILTLYYINNKSDVVKD